MFFQRAPAAIAIASALLSPAGAAMAQTYVVQKVQPAAARGYGDIHISKAVLGGQRIRIWAASLLNPDCTAAGTMTTDILESPHGGKAEISDEPFYPSFAPPNPRSACDTVKSPGKQAFYTAQQGFHGHDRLVLRNATSEGRMRRIIVDIDVR